MYVHIWPQVKTEASIDILYASRIQLQPHCLSDVHVTCNFGCLTVQEKSYTPLMVACTLGDSVHQVVELLLKSEASTSGHPEVCLARSGVQNVHV